MTKAQLYQMANDIRNALLLYNFPINSKEIVYGYKQITLEILNFSSARIGGILMKGEKHSFIGLNARRDYLEQNFDCMHELLHYWIHPHNTYTCSSIPRSSYIEWEANEGAAEILMPYYKFIPEVYDVYLYMNNGHPTFNYLKYFSDMYFVTPRVVQLRINSLSYEIIQYANGIPLNDLNILSKRAQRRSGINTPDFCLYLDFGGALDWNASIGNARY